MVKGHVLTVTRTISLPEVLEVAPQILAGQVRGRIVVEV